MRRLSVLGGGLRCKLVQTAGEYAGEINLEAFAFHV